MQVSNGKTVEKLILSSQSLTIFEKSRLIKMLPNISDEKLEMIISILTDEAEELRKA